jgi:hypothetical protein
MKAVLEISSSAIKNLIVTSITIKKTKYSMSRCRINKKLGYRHRIFIFRSSLIKVPKVNANTKLLCSFFLNRHNIRDPISISTRPNKLSIEEPIDFLFHSLINIRIKIPTGLFIELKPGLIGK